MDYTIELLKRQKRRLLKKSDAILRSIERKQEEYDKLCDQMHNIYSVVDKLEEDE